ncbi:unnamed protein product, partial [marine sediment metagenome]
NGRPLYYYSNKISLVPDNFTNTGQIILVNCNDTIINNLNINYTTSFSYLSSGNIYSDYYTEWDFSFLWE